MCLTFQEIYSSRDLQPHEKEKNNINHKCLYLKMDTNIQNRGAHFALMQVYKVLSKT